jgi:hypothetical protein
MAGRTWFAWEWGSDVLMGAAYKMAGLGGVVWLFVVAIAVVTWQWFRLNWSVGGNFLIACVFAAPMLSTTNLHWLARPHVLSWILLLMLVRAFEITRLRFTVKHGAVIAISTALWANLHAS